VRLGTVLDAAKGALEEGDAEASDVGGVVVCRVQAVDVEASATSATNVNARHTARAREQRTGRTRTRISSSSTWYEVDAARIAALCKGWTP